MTERRLILVTGAPRGATTPVGNLLAQCRSAVSLYEPLGPTGMTAITMPFPIVGEGLGLDPKHLPNQIASLRSLRLGKLKPQTRSQHEPNWQTRIFGSRTLHSLRLARRKFWSRVVIWKDPHAVLMVPDLVDRGIDVVVTIRTPWAHAASFKRLKWRSKAAEAYPRWSARFGRCARCEQYLESADDRVIAAALLWRMAYLPLIRTGVLDRVRMVTSEQLEQDERATYSALLHSLGLEPTAAVERTLSSRRRDASVAEMKRTAHDWDRSLASVNSYWREVLSAEDLTVVRALTDDLVPVFFSDVENEGEQVPEAGVEHPGPSTLVTPAPERHI